jgi:N-acetylglucosaminyldiphosphoundecaprenol N-acetyl-beta-D-mannosaminyltransferase
MLGPRRGPEGAGVRPDRPPTMTLPERCEILGIGVSPVSPSLALRAIDDWIASGHQTYVCVRDVHGVMESQRDPSLREIHKAAGMVVPDGMPLVWLSRWNGFAETERVYGPDLMLAVCERSVARGWSHFFYGGGDGVAEILVARLCRRFPGLRIAGSYSPPFRPLTPEEDAKVIDEIDRSGADIVWVGLGTPKQERWMAEHRGRLDAPVLVGVGAAFDFHAGLKRQAPRWMQRAGLEWSFRLATEPRRLWRRYLRNVPLFLALVTLEALGLRSSR